jgi:hypothetical protein
VLVFTFPAEDGRGNCVVEAELKNELVVLLKPVKGKLLQKNLALYILETKLIGQPGGFVGGYFR